MKSKGLLISAGVSGALGASVALEIEFIVRSHGGLDSFGPGPIIIMSLLCWPYIPAHLFWGHVKSVSPQLGLAVIFLGWAILGAGIYWVVSFIRGRRKPKADPPEEIALVEWDV